MKALVRSLLRRVLPLTGLRGRHKLADRLGGWAMPDPAVEVLPINGIGIGSTTGSPPAATCTTASRSRSSTSWSAS